MITRIYIQQDGTALVWDAPTLLELRAGRHILSRAIGMGSIRVSANQKVCRRVCIYVYIHMYGWMDGRLLRAVYACI